MEIASPVAVLIAVPAPLRSERLAMKSAPEPLGNEIFWRPELAPGFTSML